MPVVRISLIDRTVDEARAIGTCVYTAMRETIGIPEGDNFQILNRYTPDEVVYDPTYYGIERTNGFMIIEITLARGRDNQVKQSLFARITELLEQRCHVRPSDVVITLHEAGLADIDRKSVV